MLARIARYTVDPERCEEAVEAFTEAAREIAEERGLEQGYLFVDSESGAIVTVTVWADQTTMDASEVHAATLRRRAIGAVEGDVQSVQVFDVVRDFRG
jgi:heme-degrading monooxygenase HmoA